MLTRYRARTYAALMATPRVPTIAPTSTSSDAMKGRRALASKCGQHGHDIVRVVRAWTPDYIAYTTPFIVCSLLGPAAMHFPADTSISQDLQITSNDRELVLLAIHQFARYWKIGSLLIGRRAAYCVLMSPADDRRYHDDDQQV